MKSKWFYQVLSIFSVILYFSEYFQCIFNVIIYKYKFSMYRIL